MMQEFSQNSMIHVVCRMLADISYVLFHLVQDYANFHYTILKQLIYPDVDKIIFNNYAQLPLIYIYIYIYIIYYIYVYNFK